MTREVSALQVEEERWEGFTAGGDGREGEWAGGRVEDVDEVRDLEGGGQEWAVDIAAWAEELAVLQSLWDVEWPSCEALAEQSKKGKWERSEVEMKLTQTKVTKDWSLWSWWWERVDGRDNLYRGVELGGVDGGLDRLSLGGGGYHGVVWGESVGEKVLEGLKS